MGKALVIISVFTLLCLVCGEHEHAKHVDKKFIQGEAIRVAWLTLPEMTTYIEEYLSAITDMKVMYDELRNSKDSATTRAIWEERYVSTFRKTIDYLLVVSHVCFDVYAAEACKLPPGTWDNAYDLRGEDFMGEFIDEIHNSIKTVVKEVREATNEL